MLISKTTRREIRDIAVYLFVKVLIALANMLPRKAWLAACGVLGRLAFRFAVKTRTLTLQHLALAFPEKTSDEIFALGKRNFIMLAKNAGEILRSIQARKVSYFNNITTPPTPKAMASFFWPATWGLST